MDRLEALGNSLSQITMYDIKSMYTQAKNVVLNVSEMEAKVMEATNDEPWGASSTLMQEIAQRTFSYQYFNEIMPSIYSRFMEKEARQWRQIYKALQLLEYLIKHGSERVVDDARSHMSTIKMLRNFHYIDDKGKDEGVNVRNRARELVELLGDVDKIRQERRKAKANKHKYTGTGNDAISFSGGGGRYGGFGNDSYGGGGGDYGNGSYGGSSSSFGGGSSFRDDSSRGFEEYNAGDDEITPSSSNRSGLSHSDSVRTQTRSGGKTREAAPAPVVKEVNLLDGFGDDDPFAVSENNTTSGAGTGLATDKALPAVATIPAPHVGLDNTDDDDFTDFQAAPVQSAVPPAATNTSTKPNLMEMLKSTPPRPVGTTTTTSAGFAQPTMQPQQAGFGVGTGMGLSMGASTHRPSQSFSSQPFAPSPLQPQQPRQQNLFGGAVPLSPTSTISKPSHPTSNVTAPTNATKPAGGSANFDDLWSMSLGASASKPPAGGAAAGKSIKDLEKEKATAGLWGRSSTGGPEQKTGGIGAAVGGGAGTGTFGSFGSTGQATGSSSMGGAGGGDDLLL